MRFARSFATPIATYAAGRPSERHSPPCTPLHACGHCCRLFTAFEAPVPHHVSHRVRALPLARCNLEFPNHPAAPAQLQCDRLRPKRLRAWGVAAEARAVRLVFDVWSSGAPREPLSNYGPFRSCFVSGRHKDRPKTGFSGANRPAALTGQKPIFGRSQAIATAARAGRSRGAGTPRA